MTTHTFSPGQQAFASVKVNIRHSPGYKDKPAGDVVGRFAGGTQVQVQEGPEAVDDLSWWQVQGPNTAGEAISGWVAATAPGGKVLLSRDKPAVVPPPPGRPRKFQIGERVTNIAGKTVNIRHTPGYKDKPEDDVVSDLASGATMEVIGGPKPADDLQWWQLGGDDADAQDAVGWVAIHGARGKRFLAPSDVAGHIVVRKPFLDDFPVTQVWGRNPDFYRRFTYDGVALRGHNGIDFGIPVGNPLVSVDTALVTRTGFGKGGFGHFVLLAHPWGESVYAHMTRVDVEAGQKLESGDVLGLSGNTGASTGPHLHFGIRIHPYRRRDGWGGFVNPAPFMNPQDLRDAPISFSPGDPNYFIPSPIGEEIPGEPLP